MNNQKIAAAYMRYSSNAQDDGYSIEAQNKIINEFCKKNNYNLQYLYIDRAKTGTNANRPEFQRLMDDAKKQLFDVVIVHKTDRFSRNRYDSILYKSMLKKHNIKFISVVENFGEGIEAELMESLQEAMAEFYSKNLGREVMKTMNYLSANGLHCGGVPPLGYDVVEKRLVINPEEAEIVRLIFDMYANKHTYNYMAKELNARGYKTKVGKEFTSASFNSILSQRKYIDEYVYNKRASKDAQGRYNSHANKPESEIVRIPNAVPRIIDDETFEKVQQRLNANKRNIHSHKSNSKYLLSGLIQCGCCGFHYQGNTRKGGSGTFYSSYRCGKKQNHKIGCGNSEIEKNKLENFVIEQLQKYLFSEEAIEKMADLVNEYNKEVSQKKNNDLILYENQLKELNKELSNIASAIAKGIDEDIMVDKINQINQTKKDLEKRIKETKCKELPKISIEDITKALSLFKQYVQENNFPEIKRFIDNYVDKIVVYKEKVEVTFKVASAIFNASCQNDKTGAILIFLEIEKDEFRNYPKQRRKIPQSINFGGNYLNEFRIQIY